MPMSASMPMSMYMSKCICVYVYVDDYAGNVCRLPATSCQLQRPNVARPLLQWQQQQQRRLVRFVWLVASIAQLVASVSARLDSARPVIGGDASVIDLPACCNFQQIRPRPPARSSAPPLPRPSTSDQLSMATKIQKRHEFYTNSLNDSPLCGAIETRTRGGRG